jgi:dihydropteroate synthase
VQAEAAAHGLRPAACLLTGLSDDEIHATLLEARNNGVEALSGTDWIILNSSASKMAGMVRPGHSRLEDDRRDELASFLRATMEPALEWTMARGRIDLERPLVVGILNVTPDSFSDGGRFQEVEPALARVDQLVGEGAGMIDVGAESTRPGIAAPLTVEEEWERLHAVLPAILASHPELPLSLDTVNAETARRGLDAGVWAINDVTGLRSDAEIATVCASTGAGLILMHSRGALAELATYEHADYRRVSAEIVAELGASVGRALDAGVMLPQLVVDPGLGFSKTPEQSLTALNELDALLTFGAPVMIGPSRKRFLGHVTGHEVEQRDEDTAVAAALGYCRGARLFRVHSVAKVRDALALAHALGR